MSVTSLLTTATPSTTLPLGKFETSQTNGHVGENGVAKDGLNSMGSAKAPSALQLKLEKQLQKSRQVKAQVSYTSKDLYTGGDKKYSSEEQTPLVSYDNSEDDFEDVSLKFNDEDEDDEDVVIFKQPKTVKYRYSSADDCSEQLLRDGFRLDELSDDEDLDLIPPKADGAAWCTCDNATSCTIQ